MSRPAVRLPGAQGARLRPAQAVRAALRALLRSASGGLMVLRLSLPRAQGERLRWGQAVLVPMALPRSVVAVRAALPAALSA